MHVGITNPLTRGGGENVPGIPGACATHNFTYLVRGILLSDLAVCRVHNISVSRPQSTEICLKRCEATHKLAHISYKPRCICFLSFSEPISRTCSMFTKPYCISSKPFCRQAEKHCTTSFTLICGSTLAGEPRVNTERRDVAAIDVPKL